MKFNEFVPEASNSDFMKLEQGENKLRIVSGFETLKQHWLEKDERFVICVADKASCPYCAAGDKPSKKFFVNVIDRKDGEVKPWAYPITIQNQLANYSQKEGYEFEEIPPYDISITKTGEKLGTRYLVVPDRNNKELTEEEKEMVKNAKPISEIVDALRNKEVAEENVEGPAIKTPAGENTDIKDVPF